MGCAVVTWYGYGICHAGVGNTGGCGIVCCTGVCVCAVTGGCCFVSVSRFLISANPFFSSSTWAERAKTGSGGEDSGVLYFRLISSSSSLMAVMCRWKTSFSNLTRSEVLSLGALSMVGCSDPDGGNAAVTLSSSGISVTSSSGATGILFSASNFHLLFWLWGLICNTFLFSVKNFEKEVTFEYFSIFFNIPAWSSIFTARQEKQVRNCLFLPKFNLN